MARNHNTDRNGGAFSSEMKQRVWQKKTGLIFSPTLFDKCGDKMDWTEYGNRQHPSGWEIDHINPVANGGSDDFFNLQPLNWKNNAQKGDKLNWMCGQ